MNIFVTSTCPKICAQVLDNKRVVKMVLETAQLLSTAIFINSDITYDNLYKPTHVKHPCTIWTTANIENWDWLFRHFIALCEEYSKIHKTYTEQHKHTKVETEKTIGMFTSSVIDAIRKDNEISLIGFGNFSVSKVAARTGCTPRTGEALEIAAYNQFIKNSVFVPILVIYSKNTDKVEQK